MYTLCGVKCVRANAVDHSRSRVAGACFDLTRPMKLKSIGLVWFRSKLICSTASTCERGKSKTGPASPGGRFKSQHVEAMAPVSSVAYPERLWPSCHPAKHSSSAVRGPILMRFCDRWSRTGGGAQIEPVGGGGGSGLGGAAAVSGTAVSGTAEPTAATTGAVSHANVSVPRS